MSAEERAEEIVASLDPKGRDLTQMRRELREQVDQSHRVVSYEQSTVGQDVVRVHGAVDEIQEGYMIEAVPAGEGYEFRVRGAEYVEDTDPRDTPQVMNPEFL